ncbi:FMN-binding negative transcriptional regulator [Henriciella aquimarina]|uniref:FMN-binding negative transcriptional regulator n=1 Tax=Henriciella aquimarina TaxID=545261 RepID=UPI000A02F9D4|nr:FMN-binding negative transcriptional regulator [Henriciella aquimarina]
MKDGAVSPEPASSPFEVCEPADIRALIEAYPLAWVYAVHAGEASLLPLVGIFDEEDGLVELIGHFARSNPLWAAFEADPKATILFTGPQGYISPSQAGRRNWGPTWNYAKLHVEADISVEEDLTPEAIDVLVDHVEKDKPEPWRAAELGERYDLLMPMIIGFRARIRKLKPTFKLGQTEDEPTFRAIMSNLPEGDLKAWMARFDRRSG